MGCDTHSNLKILDIVYFCAILGMDLLYPQHAIKNFNAKTVILAIPRIYIVEWRGFLNHIPQRVI